jgi:hypothetical protein
MVSWLFLAVDTRVDTIIAFLDVIIAIITIFWLKQFHDYH